MLKPRKSWHGMLFLFNLFMLISLIFKINDNGYNYQFFLGVWVIFITPLVFNFGIFYICRLFQLCNIKTTVPIRNLFFRYYFSHLKFSSKIYKKMQKKVISKTQSLSKKSENRYINVGLTFLAIYPIIALITSLTINFYFVKLKSETISVLVITNLVTVISFGTNSLAGYFFQQKIQTKINSSIEFNNYLSNLETEIAFGEAKLEAENANEVRKEKIKKRIDKLDLQKRGLIENQLEE